MPFSLYNHPRLIAYLYHQAVQPSGSTAIDPQNELTQCIHVVSDGMGRVVTPLKKAPVMNDRVGNGHGFPHFR